MLAKPIGRSVEQDNEPFLSTIKFLARRLRSDAMVNPNRQDNGEPEGEDQLKDVVILHGQRGYGVGTRASAPRPR